MSGVLTLVSLDGLADLQGLLRGHLSRIAPLTAPPVILSVNRAIEVALPQYPSAAQIRDMRAIAHADRVDIFITHSKNRRKKLLLADMDSTIVAEETLDELAGYAGLHDKVAAITARAMNGELDFHAAIKERVALLAGLPQEKLAETLAENTINEGAKTLVATMKKHGATCILVSGGFTFFTQAIAQQVGFDGHHGNILQIEGGVLTGRVIEPILDKDSKLRYLNEYCTAHGITPDSALAMGDGANDWPMLEAAGLGLGYYPRANLAEKLTNMIRFNDLSAALYAQGYNDAEIITE